MRRGKLDNYSITFIIIAAIFAIISFSLDQMVIQTEDKIRNKNAEYQLEMFNFQQYSSIGSSQQHLSDIILVDQQFWSYKNELYFGILKKLMFDPNYINKRLNINQEDEKKLLKIYKEKYFSLLKEYLVIIDRAIQKEKSISYIDNNLITLHSKILEHYENIDRKNLLLFIKDNNGEKHFTNAENLNKFYFKLRSLNDIFFKARSDVSNIGINIMTKWMSAWEKASAINIEITSLKKNKNYFILFSVLAQISGLLFLLLLFRNIILKINITKKPL